MNTEEEPYFRHLPKEEDFSLELTKYLNKNVTDLVIPKESSRFKFSLYIAKFDSPL